MSADTNVSAEKIGPVFANDGRELDWSAYAAAESVTEKPPRDLTDPEIVEVLASLGIDAEKSKYGFDALQVHTTVPGVRNIVAAYLKRAAPVTAAKAVTSIPPLPGCLPDRLFEAISMARDSAENDGSNGRIRKWEATAADLRAALSSGAQPARDARDGAEWKARAELAEGRLAFLHSVNKDADGYEYGIAKVKFSPDGQVESFLWTASDNSDIDAAIDRAASAAPSEQKGGDCG